MITESCISISCKTLDKFLYLSEPQSRAVVTKESIHLSGICLNEIKWAKQLARCLAISTQKGQ